MVGPILAILIPAALAQAPKSKEAEPESKPAWQRMLLGEDAKHVEALTETILELEKKGRFTETIALAQEVAAIRHKVQGENHWETASARIKEQTCERVAGLPPGDQADMAVVIRLRDEADNPNRTGRYADAEPLARDIRRTCHRILGEDHALTAESVSDLAVILDAQGKYAEAEPLHRKARRSGTALGENHPDRASCYNLLALNLGYQRKYAAAEPLHRKRWRSGHAPWVRTTPTRSQATTTWPSISTASRNMPQPNPSCARRWISGAASWEENHRDTGKAATTWPRISTSRGSMPSASHCSSKRY